MAFPAALLAVAYCIGSIPFSYLVVRLMAGSDIRRQGSGNVGATNVARTAGRVPGVIALLLDLAKGYAAVALARAIVSRPDWPYPAGAQGDWLYSAELWISASALVAVLGHMFPLWLRFQGGKGVATASGAFLALDWRVMAAGFIIFLIVVILTRFISLGSIISAASIPLFFRFLTDAPFWRIVFSILIALAIIAKHHSNIRRLAQGSERRMGQRREDQ